MTKIYLFLDLIRQYSQLLLHHGESVWSINTGTAVRRNGKGVAGGGQREEVQVGQGGSHPSLNNNNSSFCKM